MYPSLRLDGQYTLQRVLTLPNNAGAPLTTEDIGIAVTLNADGFVVKPSAAETPFFGILRTVASDGFVTVDFSGVYNSIASGAAVNAGAQVTVNAVGKVVPATEAVAYATKAVALTKATAADQTISIMFLN